MFRFSFGLLKDTEHPLINQTEAFPAVTDSVGSAGFSQQLSASLSPVFSSHDFSKQTYTHTCQTQHPGPNTAVANYQDILVVNALAFVQYKSAKKGQRKTKG